MHTLCAVVLLCCSFSVSGAPLKNLFQWPSTFNAVLGPMAIQNPFSCLTVGTHSDFSSILLSLGVAPMIMIKEFIIKNIL